MRRYSPTPAVCLTFLSFFLATAVPAADMPKLVVGGDHENPPYEFIENGRPTGFNVELMRAVANAAGADVEFRLGPWSQVRSDLEEGKIDALAGMYYSEERSKAVDFSVPHTMVTAGLFVRNGSPLRSIDDMRGKEVIVQKGDVMDDYLRGKGIASRLIELKDPADLLRLLASGRHDCALMPSRFQGEYLVRSLGISNVRAMSADLPQLRYCFAVKKGNTSLKYRLDEGLNILKVNGKYKEIYDKWFGVYEKSRMWRTVSYLIWALAIIAGLLAASSVWSWTLRREVRKRTAELRDREENLRFTQFAIENAEDQAFWMTEEGRFLYVNAAACRALAYTREELLQMSVPDIDPIYQPGKFAEHWRDLQENGYATFETLHRSKDGRVYPVEIRANYVIFDGKEYNCAFATDISERKRIEEELHRAHDGLEKQVLQRTAELEAANNELEAFTYSVSHDLRAPLRSINGFSRVIQEDYAEKLDAEGKNALERIVAATERMGQLIDDLLDLSRTARAEMRRERVNLSGNARRIAGRLREAQPEREVEFNISEDLAVDGDERLLAVVLENLLNNAWKFTEKTSHAVIEFGATQLDGAPSYFVRDNGAGFDMAYAGNLFSPFQRLHNVDQFPGTGIGLATVKRIVSRHGGRVWAEGEVGKGATFYFTL